MRACRSYRAFFDACQTNRRLRVVGVGRKVWVHAETDDLRPVALEVGLREQ